MTAKHPIRVTPDAVIADGEAQPAVGTVPTWGAEGAAWLAPAVASVAGRTGAVTLTAADVASGQGWDSIATVSGSDATTTGQTLVDITGLTAAVLAASVYEFEAMLKTVASADTNGMEVGVACTQTPQEVVATVLGNTATTTAAVAAIVAAATATAAFNTSSAGVGVIVIKGQIHTHATLAGTLSIQHLKVTSGTSTVKVGSTLKVRKVA